MKQRSIRGVRKGKKPPVRNAKREHDLRKNELQPRRIIARKLSDRTRDDQRAPGSRDLKNLSLTDLPLCSSQ
jgi:hypothetical protein